MSAEVSPGLSTTRRGSEGHPILSSPPMPSPGVGGWAELKLRAGVPRETKTPWGVGSRSNCSGIEARG